MVSPTMDRAAWLKERTSYLGGTDVASIVGKNKWKSPLAVYEEKVLGKADTGASEAAEAGIALEPVCRTWFERDTKLAVLDGPQHLRHPDYPYLGANLDGLVGTRAIWENKTHGLRTAHEWGEEGSDEIPEAYHVQCVWYLGLTGREAAFVMATDTGSWKRRHYTVQSDPAYFDALVKIAVRWWSAHVVAKVAPEATGHPADLDVLDRLYPRAGESLVHATPAQDSYAEDLLDVAGRLKALTKNRDGLKARLIAAIGEAAGIETAVGRFTYRNDPDKDETDWRAVVDYFRALVACDVNRLERMTPAEYLEAIEESIRLSTTTKPGSRRFLMPKGGK